MSYRSDRYSVGAYGGYGGYSSYTPSYSSYSSSSYDPYSTRKYSYQPRTYDFGTSSFLSKNYGSSDYYTRRYDEYSWKAKDLMTDNPAKGETVVQRKDSTREKYKFYSVTESQDREELVMIEETERKDESEDDGKSSKPDITHEEKHSEKDYLRDIDSRESKRNTHEDSRYSNTGSAKKDYSFTREYDFSKEDTSNEHKASEDYTIMGSKRKNYKNIDSNGLDHNLNHIDDVDSSMKNLSLHGDKEKTTRKKVYNFEESDDDVFVKPEKEKSLQSGKDSIFGDSKKRWWNDTNYDNSQSKREIPRNTPTDTNSSVNPTNQNSGNKSANQKVENHRIEQPKSKSASDVPDSGPLRMHPQRVAKYISAVPDQNRYVSSVKFLPDRIELRFIGSPATEKKMKRCRSITDLYEITVQPDDNNQEPSKKHPWEETVKCQKQEMAYAYDSENEILHYTRHAHEHTKEMYISQYTHHFDPDEPRTHIAGWKVGIEPNGIPHERSRMCVMRSPVVSDSPRRVARPKSAPPKLFRSVSPVESIRSQKVEVYERGYSTLPRRKDKEVHEDFFQTSVDESMTEDASSVGYAPSDDTSDSSAFYFNDHNRYYYENNNKDPNFGYNKPRLIRLSAEFPGIRNLEKMRRKRQSMGSYSSGGSRSSVGHSPSPRNGEYGFFIALTSGDPRQSENKRQHRYSHYY